MKTIIYYICILLTLAGIAGITYAEEDPAVHGPVTCKYCHRINETSSHFSHVYAERGPSMTCTSCHSSDPGTNILKDGESLSNTTICDTCHSSGGTYDGVNDQSIGAKPNWANGVYNGPNLKEGKGKWCVGCHDNNPSIINGEIAPNKEGDGNTYGYFVTGHGRETNYARMSWQDTSATGNPGANRSCADCHNGSSRHIVSGPNPDHRMKPGYENDDNNSNCNNCHYQGGSAGSDPQFYTNSQDYESSVHKDIKCTQCHDVHGNTTYIAMTKGDKERLCLQCHVDKEGHAINVQFGKAGKTYNLQCTSCHNIHIISGNGSGKSPISKLSNITKVWGDDANENMNAYAGSGTYRTPKGDSLSGSQLPDYPTFCLDCHGDPEFGIHGGISWSGDNHGLVSANEPDGYGTCPNWFACGLAEGWDNDVCTNESECWPVLPRGRGDELFSRPAYNHEERIAGANFVLSCSDCHVTHESGIGSKLRSTVNGAPGSTTWNIMCNACHYYYSDWHAGMSCGSASCHATNSLHNMQHSTGSGATRIFNRDLVADMKFENDLKDSGSFQMDGRWYSQYDGGGTGSFVLGKFGQAIQVDGNQPVEIGSEDQYWSTDSGYHNTWVYSEMKKNMTLETWIYPTGSQAGGENIIFAKHTYLDGGYALLLKNIEGTLRAAAQVNVNGGEVPWNSADCNGLRGAYSSIPIPLNKWTHVAVVFDSNLPDKNPDNLSIGRVRIYVNGEDVTTSYSNVNQCYAQPGAGEEDIFPYSEMGIKNVSRCYGGQWCASALSIGGLMWGSGSRKGLIGKIDESKVWNVAKPEIYFETADQLSPPRISKIEGAINRDWINVTFSEGVYTNTGSSGGLQIGDFSIVDTDNSRTIVNVNHNAGSSVAILTLSSPLDIDNDIGVDTIAANSNAIYDEYNNPAETDSVLITGRPTCPTGPTIFQLNNAAGSTTTTDDEGIIRGKVNDSSQTFLGDGYFHGDGINNDIYFENNTQCMQASATMTLETRIKPSIVDNGGGNTIQRIFARDGTANYQISVWRNNDSVNYPNYKPPTGVASIAFWMRPIDSHGGDVWKPVLTNYTYYPIVATHWYKIKIVMNSGKTGAIPVDIFVDDQGTDGNGTSENWAGFVNATDSYQLQLTPNKRLYIGDQIMKADGQFVIGANVNMNNLFFNGLIDYLTWKDSVDYSLE